MTDITSSTKSIIIDAVKNAFPTCEVTEKVVKKAYGDELGLMIKPSGSKIAPTVYFANEEDIQRTGVDAYIAKFITAIEKALLQSDSTNDDFLFVKNWNEVKDRLRMKLINKANTGYLEDKPYVMFEDLPIVFCIDVTDIVSEYSNEDTGKATIPVTNGVFDEWGISKGEAYNVAKANMKDDYELRDMFGLLVELKETTGTNDPFLDAALKDASFMDGAMYVLTSKDRIDGAIMFPILVDTMKVKFGKFYMLPSSRHEVIILLDRNGENNKEALDFMVREINTTQVLPEDILSDHAYAYTA